MHPFQSQLKKAELKTAEITIKKQNGWIATCYEFIYIEPDAIYSDESQRQAPVHLLDAGGGLCLWRGVIRNLGVSNIGVNRRIPSFQPLTAFHRTEQIA